ncbi:preprotein translocase subunit SecE [Thiomicrospira cyclica]|jgi:preprotein translocase subunit SecE|uniref:Protein translocase subunit SecE n=1 Tax=Thiomicrospira cyclica (strain DSM 14477 / JCM 11371 / ALM1) TaxID=717773 RepID=F6D954_THICA|nr:preprotein translocase subunit SecE [Thiomicrospira cyclica]AEG30885.1 preprotein translocase, SecE subunit [Thiomicrospira cyclica ALM1]
MNKNPEVQEARSTADTAKLVLSLFILVGGIFAYYYLSDLHAVIRVLVVIAGAVGAVAVLYTTALGGSWFKYLIQTKKEIRQVVWPTRKETAQTTLIVVIAVIIVGIFLWLIDMFFLWAVKLLTGQGG